MKTAGLFAGVGGIELGLSDAGHSTELLSELDPGAAHVLRCRFPDATVVGDIRSLKRLPDVDLVAAGFPCQDLSQAGGKGGIRGAQSGLVDEVFRLLHGTKRPPEWVLIENVAYMLRLDRGRAMGYLTTRFEELGYTWAYRLVDARGFGIPQRRQRVMLLAARSADPREVLFCDEGRFDLASDEIGFVRRGWAYGFYWTEGLRGLGWVGNGVPTVKGGSTVGIPSPPAVWIPEFDFVGTPTLEDAERLQGFSAGWTEPADEQYERPRRRRWALVGNAVCVPMARWVGARVTHPGSFDEGLMSPMGDRWPSAAWGGRGQRFAVKAGLFPLDSPQSDLVEFLQDDLEPLSLRAVSGFLSRAHRSTLEFPQFLSSLESYRARSEALAA